MIENNTAKISKKLKKSELDVSLNMIGEILANYFGVEQKDIFVRSRKIEILKIRYSFMLLAKSLNNISYQAIGDYCEDEFQLPRFHHGTVMNACAEAQNFIDTDPDFKFHFEEVKADAIDISKVVSSHHNKIKQIKQKILIEVSKSSNLEDILSLFRVILADPNPERLLIS